MSVKVCGHLGYFIATKRISLCIGLNASENAEYYLEDLIKGHEVLN